MAYPTMTRTGKGGLFGSKNKLIDDDEGKRLKSLMTWTTFLSYVERSSLRIRRLRFAYFGDEIGQGQFFEVYRYKIEAGDRLAFTTQGHELLAAGTVVALKRVIPRPDANSQISLDDSRQLRAIATEIQALSKPSLQDNENIVKMYALAWEDRGGDSPLWPTMIMEYCQCTLAELQSEREHPLIPLLKHQIVAGVSLGVDALHREDIIHGDIKSENVLIKITEDGMFVPKLADFGSSIVQLQNDLVDIGGTDPWRAPECVDLKGKISVDFAFETDLYSLGLLIWRVIRNGQNPFDLLYDIDYVCRKTETDAEIALSPLRPEESEVSEGKQVLTEKEYIDSAVQRLKKSNAVIQMAIDDLKYLDASDPRQLSGYKVLFSVYLIADPEARCEAVKAIGKELGISSDIDTADGDSSHPYAISNWQYSRFPTTLFSIHKMIRQEILDPELRIEERTRKRIFQELLLLAKQWDEQTHPECTRCCEMSPFDGTTTGNSLTLENYLNYLIEEAENHTCDRENMALSYNISAKEGKYLRNEIFIVLLNLSICYIDGFGVQVDVDKALTWVQKAARWGSSIAQNEFATYLIYFGKPIPTDIPVIKWLMNSVVLLDQPHVHRTLSMLNSRYYEIAQLARRVMFNGIDITFSNWKLYPESEFSLEKYAALLGSSEQDVSERVDTLSSDINIMEVESNSDNGNTVAHYLATSWREPVNLCRRFCEKYPDLLNSPNDHGETPLLLACRSYRYSMIKLLLELGADAARSSGSGGETPLHWLATVDDDGVYNAIEDMLCHGAEINAQCTQVRMYFWRPPRGTLWSSQELFYVGSALHWAVLTEKPRMIRFLIKKGASLEIKSVTGVTPVSMAVFMRRNDLLEILLEGRKLDEIDPADGSLLRGLYYDSTRHMRVMQGFTDYNECMTLKLLLNSRPQNFNQNETEEYFKLAIYNGVCTMSFELLSTLLESLDH